MLRNNYMSGTILGYCSSCGMAMDWDPLLSGAQKCDDCEEIINDKIKYEEQISRHLL
jgi:hypothetical protein